jgi:hypothetical protein
MGLHRVHPSAIPQEARFGKSAVGYPPEFPESGTPEFLEFTEFTHDQPFWLGE